MMKIGFFVMGKKGLVAIEAMLRNPAIRSSSDIAFIASAPDLSIQLDYYDEIQSAAHTYGVKFIDKNDIVLPLPICDYAIAIGWRWLLPSDRLKIITLHDSLLPKYRGFNPLVTALIEGDEEIGVTAIFAEKEFDKGPIIDHVKITIAYPIKIGEAIDMISTSYAELLQKVMTLLITGEVVPREQDESLASYSLWRNEEDYQVDWNQSASRIRRFVDASGFPYKGATTEYDHRKIILHQTSVQDDLVIANRTAGKLLSIENNEPVVVCGKGLLRILKATHADSGEIVKFNKLRIKLT